MRILRVTLAAALVAAAAGCTRTDGLTAPSGAARERAVPPPPALPLDPATQGAEDGTELPPA
ncbi:MAG TPA: hypothetical protein VF665_21595, partial [Longimicrobium sp.]